MMAPMIILLILYVSHATQGRASKQLDGRSNSTDVSPVRCSPLLISDCVTVSPDGYVSDNHLLMVLNLLENLKWNHTIVFYDLDYWENEIHLLSPILGLTTTYDLSDLHSSVVVKQLLQQLHKMFFPHLNFILLSNCSRAMEILQIVDRFDLESNRTTEFCHYSFWVVCCDSPDQPITRHLPHIFHLENVVLVVSDKTDNLGFYQLVATPGGRSLSTRLSFVEKQLDIFPNTRYGLNKRTLIVSTMVYEPFVMKNGDTFEGYYIDILDAIASTLNFSYEIVYPHDMSYGRLKEGRWDGLIGQLQRREVDLTVAALSIHEDREKVMDFLYPPIYTWIDDIMFKLYTEETENWPFYLRPFTPSVFLILTITLGVITLFGYILYRWDDCNTEGKRKGVVQRPRLYIFADMFFYLFGILMARGLESNPNNQSTRMLLFTWGGFSVIIAACYSANLVASFADQKRHLPFTNLGELVSQTEYKWGFRSGAIREHIFKMSRSGDMTQAWKGALKFNKTDPEVLSGDYSVHIAKVMSEKYATIIHRYKIQTLRGYDCSIRYVGQDITWQHLGLGVPADYPLKKELEDVLSAIADSGLLDIWWRRWSQLKTDPCIEDRKVNSLTFTDVASILYIICGGLGVSGVALVIEFMTVKCSILTDNGLCRGDSSP